MALARRCRPYAHRSGCQLRWETIPINFRHRHHGLDSQSLTRTHDAHGDLATVCHEQAVDCRHRLGHRYWDVAITISILLNSTIIPFSTRIRITTPSTPALIELNSFITPIPHT